MGRKKRIKQLSKDEFKKFVCLIECNYCKNLQNPTFCYNLYSKDNLDFEWHILKEIKKHVEFLDKLVNSDNEIVDNSMIAVQVFKRIFCNSEVCKSCNKKNKNIIGCIKKFKKQYRNQKINCKKEYKDTKTKVKIIMSSNKEFQSEVKKILESNN